MPPIVQVLLSGVMLLAAVFSTGAGGVPLSNATPVFPVATNIAQLRSLVGQSRRVLCSLALRGVICSAEPGKDQFVFMDASGAELMQLDCHGRSFVAGEPVRIDAQHVSVSCNELGLIVGRSPVVDNDGIHPMLRRSGQVYLEPGLHPVRLLWFNARDKYGLKVCYQGPGFERKIIPDSALFRMSTNLAGDARNIVPGLDYRCYEGAWLNMASGFVQRTPVTSGHTTNFTLGVRHRDEWVGLEFAGLLQAPSEGVYTFDTESDDGSILYVAEPAPKVFVDRIGPTPSPRHLVISQVLDPTEAGQWSEVEGTVSFASQSGSGAKLEISTEAGRMDVILSDGPNLPLSSLVHRQIRARGIARGLLSLEGPQVLGRLTVLDGADISLTQTELSPGQYLPLLTSGEEVKRLKREDAERGYPVRIRGIVTRAVRGYDSIVIQDSTRGVYVQGLRPEDAAGPRFGEYWEIEGRTAPGDFAPVVQWERGHRLGAGRLPAPVTATWDQLMSGSLDTQWVEIEGVVTATARNRLELKLSEGKITLGFLDTEADSLDQFENALVRVRGCLFPSWDRQTHRLNIGQVNISDPAISVEEAAPADLFSTPAKRASDLLLYDPDAGALERVKLAGIFLGSWDGEEFMADGANGVRFDLRHPADLMPGDLVEVVGYPALGGLSPVLHDAVARKTGHARLPRPELLPAEHWFDPGHDASLVRVQGVLTGVRGDRGRIVLQIETGWRHITARVNQLSDSLPELGSRLELTGVYSATGGGPSAATTSQSFDLLVNSPSEIRLLARPPWLTLSRVLIALASLAFILVLAMLWAFSLRRRVAAQTAIIREKAHRETALEERARIAKDIHDDVGSNLTYIMMLGERSREDLAKPGELAAHTDRIVSCARATVQSLDEIVWAINPQNDSVDALVGYLNQYATQFFENTAIRCRLDIPERLSSLTLPSEIRHDLFLVVKEALNNVLKHSQAAEVKVAVTENAGSLEIAIEDNGLGFDPDRNGNGSYGDGLKNMGKRMTRIGGSFSMDTAPKVGTKIKLTIHLRRLQIG